MSREELSSLGPRVSIYCPHCGRHTSLEPTSRMVRHGYEEVTVPASWQQARDVYWWIGVCNYCAEPVLVKNLAETVYPQPLPAPTDPNVPDDIRKDLDEAKQCFSVSAWRASATMARRTMQAAAIDKGASGDKLADQVADLASKNKITADLMEWADVVRWVGNDAAHPGGDEVNEEDAEDVLKLAEQFLHVLYVAPALAGELRKKRGR